VQGVVAKENQSLTMPEVVNGLSRSGLLGKTILKGSLSPGPLSGATDDKTNDRARRVINGYFGKLREANQARWEDAREAYISTNPGIRAQLLLVADIFRYLQAKEDLEPQLLDEDTLVKNLVRVARPVFDFIRQAEDVDIYDKFSRKFGEGGVREYADNLSELVMGKFESFGSEDFRSRLAKRSDERVKQTDQDVIQLTKDITDYVFKVLKRIYGEAAGKSGQPMFWEKGVESPKIKREAYARMADEGLKHPMEAYVYALEIKEIILQKNNWPHFEDVFNIPMKNEQKGKAHYTSWLAKFNEIRRISGHSSSARTYEEDDYDFMKHIKFEFYRRRNSALGVRDAGQA
jgi:hypothetical protein